MQMCGVLWGHSSIKSSSVLSGDNSCETGQINCCLNQISHLMILAKICLCVSFWEKKGSLGLARGKNKVWGGKKFSFCVPVFVYLAVCPWGGVSFLSLYLSATSLLFPFLSFPHPPYNVPLCRWHLRLISPNPKCLFTLFTTDRPQESSEQKGSLETS